MYKALLWLGLVSCVAVGVWLETQPPCRREEGAAQAICAYNLDIRRLKPLLPPGTID